MLHEFADPGLAAAERPKKYVAPVAAKGAWQPSKLVHIPSIGDFLVELTMKLKRSSASA